MLKKVVAIFLLSSTFSFASDVGTVERENLGLGTLRKLPDEIITKSIFNFLAPHDLYQSVEGVSGKVRKLVCTNSFYRVEEIERFLEAVNPQITNNQEARKAFLEVVKEKVPSDQKALLKSIREEELTITKKELSSAENESEEPNKVFKYAAFYKVIYNSYFYYKNFRAGIFVATIFFERAEDIFDNYEIMQLPFIKFFAKNPFQLSLRYPPIDDRTYVNAS